MANLSDIRDRSITEYLKLQGYSPVRVTDKNTWYNSPLRSEDHPSFVVSNDKNRWKDMGNQKKGSLIDLVMELENVGLREACEILGANDRLIKHIPTKVPRVSIDLVDVMPLKDEYLLSYMRGRHIPDEITKMYCEEVYYTYPKKDTSEQRIVRAVGFKNNLGGYELRSSIQKVCVGTKCFTTIPGDTRKYMLFEGFTSFLSALVHYKVDKPKWETFVLNGAGLLNITLPFLDGREGFIYSDNDKAGDEIYKTLGGKDMRYVYEGQNDMNDFLILNQ